jgi:hypothetical protein
MLQIEAFPCANGNEARARERYWYEQLNATLNTLYPNRSQKEYNDVNKDKIKEYKKEYGKEYKKINKVKIGQQSKEYSKINKDKIHDFYEANKDIIKERSREYTKKNKDSIKAKRAVPYSCECGSVCRIGDKSQHFKSLKHQAFIAQKDNTKIKI